MDFIAAIKATKISDSTENIYIRNIEFNYDSDTIFYNGIRLNAVMHKNEDMVYVEFNNTDELQTIIGFKNFYILNQVYKFDPTITTNEKSTILFSNKSIEDLDILVDAIIDVYNGKINARTSDYICFRLENNCSVTIYFSYVYNDDAEGYLLELIHNQTTLYKQEFNAFITDFSKMID